MNNYWMGLYQYYTDSSLEDIYNVLESDDLSDCVVLARNVLNKTNNWLEFNFNEKSTSVSQNFLQHGLVLMSKGNAELALLGFNTALMFAPNNSEIMQLAYCGRAELLLKFPAHCSLSLNNINTCLALNCPQDLVDKLTKMKSTASKSVHKEKEALEKVSTPFTNNFFKLKGNNVDVPCATPDVDVIVESGQVKVVAAKNIVVGTLLANETAFMAATHSKNVFTSCHYCLRISPDLKPCDGCCTALFCDENCKEKSMLEGHDVECKIADIIVNDVKLPFKTVLKIRRLCNSWEEFIAVSNDLGTDGIKNEITSKIFGSNKFSVLKPRADNPFIHGRMFNRCMCIVNIIHYLETRTSFLPEGSEEKEAAIRAVARIFLYLSLYCTPVKMLHVARYICKVTMQQHDYKNCGYFPLIGNLAHSCTPNTYVIGLRNSAALIALKPIKRGEQLTFSYIGH
ncbi:SET and MYND domain-containing protein 4-like [Spodoptera litura]|uniref:SET and MYND domain-containing protein 4-like n=1 Tax=Spodoptera litura TaxID=69820 RepID=A0A9J7IR60_SPOLT|nr:SET and MYND domain-containing protein 4-like [Spodoptera litura]